MVHLRHGSLLGEEHELVLDRQDDCVACDSGDFHLDGR